MARTAGNAIPRKFRYLRVTDVTDFSGGWNNRDSPSEVADNESPDLLNVTLDERGGIMKRLGLYKLNSSQFNSTKFNNIFYSPTLNITIAQQGTKLARSTDAGATWTELQTSAAATPCFTDSDRVGFTEFLGIICIMHPGATDGGIYTYDNSTAKISAKLTNSPKSSMGAAYQNRLFTAGDPGHVTRVTNSDPGALTWTTAGTTYNTNDFRTKDDSPITAIGGGEGVDVSGRSGILVWKEESLYRVNDSDKIAYDPLSIEYGASGPLAVESLAGITAGISRKGIVVVDDKSSSGVNVTLVSDRVQNLFRSPQLNFGQMSLACAGIYNDRIVFSLPRNGSNVNNLSLEFHPTVGWIVPHSFGVSAMTTYTHNDQVLFGAAANSGYMYQVFRSGADDGAAIAARYQSRWFNPSGDSMLRLRRVRLSARGTFQMYVKWDYSVGQGLLGNVVLDSNSGFAIYGSSVYNDTTAIYGPGAYEAYQDFPSLGYGKSVAYQFTHTGTTSSTGPPLLVDGAALEVGAFSVYAIQSLFHPLGLA